MSYYILRKNKFFENFFYHFRTLSGNFSSVRRKKFSRVSRRHSTCPKGWLQAKVCLKKNLLFNRLRTLKKWFLPSEKKLGKVSQNQSTCSWEQFDENFCLKNSCFSIVFGHLEIVFRPFAEVFRNRRQNCFLVVERNSLRKLFLGKKSVFPLLTKSKKLLAICRRVY